MISSQEYDFLREYIQGRVFPNWTEAQIHGAAGLSRGMRGSGPFLTVGRVEERGKDAEKQRQKGPEGPQQLGLGGSNGVGKGPFPAGWPSDSPS